MTQDVVILAPPMPPTRIYHGVVFNVKAGI